MRLFVDNNTVGIICELDTEADGVDLTRDELGLRILEAGIRGIRSSILIGRDPATGQVWAPLRPSTVRAKDHATVGYRTGAMFGSDFSTEGAEVDARRASWGFPGPRGKIESFHNGNDITQKARPLVGWSPTAAEEVKQLLRDADRFSATRYGLESFQ